MHGFKFEGRQRVDNTNSQAADYQQLNLKFIPAKLQKQMLQSGNLCQAKLDLLQLMH